MKIIDIRATKGPNYWSIRLHKLIVMTLDLEKYETLPTNKLPGFSKRLEKLIPSLYDHHCSEGCLGGFLSRVKTGTWLGHVVEHIALEIQVLAGLQVDFGRTRGTGAEGVYHVVFSYVTEKAGRYAADAAVRIVRALAENERYKLEPDLEKIRELHAEEHLGPSTASIVTEAERRGIPWLKLNNGLIQLGFGARQKRISATITGLTSSIAVDIACDKEETKEMLKYFNIPVANGKVVHNRHDLQQAIVELGYPLVIKPLNSNQGKGASIGVTNWQGALAGLMAARKYSDRIIVEQFIEGADHRILLVNKQFVAAALRTPAAVKGDGISTIRQLIEQVNKDPSRGNGHEKVLTQIKVDGSTKRILRLRNLTLSSVLPAGEVLHLKETANLSTGGTSTDVTELVHPDNIFMAEQIAQIIGLDICGIDIICKDISRPIRETGGAVLEVNAAPGFRMHLNPTIGKARNVATPVVDMLFPHGQSPMIPIIAVTGTNGKTTTTRLIAHMAKLAGHTVGFTCTDGIYVDGRLIETGDCSGPGSAGLILKNPSVDFAVLECARGGILRSGLAFPTCHVGIITNVSEDHLGLDGINDLQKLAWAKSVIAETVAPDGYAILNADDDRVYEMKKRVAGKTALFSLNPDNPRIQLHVDAGGLAAILEAGYITLLQGGEHIRIEKLINTPITLGGKAMFMVENVLAAVLAGYTSGFNLHLIRAALQTFSPTPEQAPGRLNLFQMDGFDVMVDYVHNPAGLQAIGKMLEKIESRKKIGIIASVGDRRDEDIREMGRLSVNYFDEIILRLDTNLRGRTSDEIIRLLKEGIDSSVPDIPVSVIPDEREALIHAMENAVDGSFIFLASESPQESIELLSAYRDRFLSQSVKHSELLVRSLL